MSSIALPSTLSTSEDDSTYGGSCRGDRTVSLTPTATKYYEYFGRRYRAEDHQYPYPNDEVEMDCLHLQHEVSRKILHGKLFLAPISETPSNILDLGTGTGIWAIDVADEYPSAVVIGTDISPIQPKWVPQNCSFLMENANDTWDFKTKFDFIHCREVRMCLYEKKLFTQALESLRHGGWFEIAEMTLPMICDDATWEGTALKSWAEDMMEGSRILKTPFHKPYYYRMWMEEAGFINVEEVIHDVALNPTDEELSGLGKDQKVALHEGLEGFSLKMYTKLLGWSKDELAVHLARVKKELRRGRIHASCRWIRVFGQKPRSNAELSSQTFSWPENNVHLLSSSVITSTAAQKSTLADSRLSLTMTSEASCSERPTPELTRWNEDGAEMISTPSLPQSDIQWTLQTKQNYAACISNQEWAESRECIESKHFSGFTTGEILRSLKEENGFCPTHGQLRKQMKKWKLTRCLPIASQADGCLELEQEKAREPQLLDELRESMSTGAHAQLRDGKIPLGKFDTGFVGGSHLVRSDEYRESPLEISCLLNDHRPTQPLNTTLSEPRGHTAAPVTTISPSAEVTIAANTIENHWLRDEGRLQSKRQRKVVFASNTVSMIVDGASSSRPNGQSLEPSFKEAINFPELRGAQGTESSLSSVPRAVASQKPPPGSVQFMLN